MNADDPGEDIAVIEINESPSTSPVLHSTRRSFRLRNVHDTSIITGHIPNNDDVVGEGSNSFPTEMQVDAQSEEQIIKEEIKEDKAEEVKSSKKRALSDSDDEEEGMLCPICFDYWTNSGEHRLTALKCGHLFGHQCIKRWLKGDTKNCPTCKMKAHSRDMRFIYAKSLKVKDTTELESLKNQLNKVTAEKSKLELEYQVCMLNMQLLSKEIKELKKNSSTSTNTLSTNSSSNKSIGIYLEKNLEMSSDAGCRVFSYNSHYQLLAVSQKSQGNIFAGYGVKLIDMKLFKPLQFVYLSQKQVRNIQFSTLNVDLLLTVSLDKTAKIYDIQRKSIILVINTDIQLWSCCWDGNNPNLFYIGGQSGTFLKYDVTNTQTCLDTYKVEDMSPIISLCAIPACAETPLPQGGVLVCNLKSCWVTDTRDSVKKIIKLPFEGSFVSLSYENSSNHILISARPCSKYKNTRHIVATLDKVNDIITAVPIHVFLGGGNQNLMSRSCQIMFNGDYYVTAYDEDYHKINVWSIKTEQKIKVLPVSNATMDLCGVQVESNYYLASLSETALRIYKVECS